MLCHIVQHHVSSLSCKKCISWPIVHMRTFHTTLSMQMSQVTAGLSVELNLHSFTILDFRFPYGVQMLLCLNLATNRCKPQLNGVPLCNMFILLLLIVQSCMTIGTQLRLHSLTTFLALIGHMCVECQNITSMQLYCQTSPTAFFHGCNLHCRIGVSPHNILVFTLTFVIAGWQLKRWQG